MSYEGFYELLCERGHYHRHDAYESEPKACPVCGDGWGWSHGVDQTNGYDESDPSTCKAGKSIKAIDDVWCKDRHGNRYAREVRLYEPAPGAAWRKRENAQGTEAQRAETVKQGSVHDGPVPERDAPTL